MFTGIIEAIATLKERKEQGSSLKLRFCCTAPDSEPLKPGQSLAHDGVCLSIEEIHSHGKLWDYSVSVVSQSLVLTQLSTLRIHSQVNIERGLSVHSRLDGHILQGHIDCTATITEIKKEGSSWNIWIRYPSKHAPLLVNQGSIAINGISLTVAELSAPDVFRVCMIPITVQETSAKNWQEGLELNLEFDLFAKYLQRHLQKLPKSKDLSQSVQ